MKTENIELKSGLGHMPMERPKSGTELFDKMLLTEFGEFCLNSFVKGCIRNAADLEMFKSRFPNQTEIIMQIFNYLHETDKLVVNDDGYFRLVEFTLDLRIKENSTDDEVQQIQFLYSEKIKKMAISAMREKHLNANKKPYVGSIVFTVTDHPEVEIKKSAVTAEIMRLLTQLSDLDATKVREGYKPKGLSNFAFIGSIVNPEIDNSEVI